MHKLDWYILRNFLVTFIFCNLLFVVIAVAIDSSEKTDNFVQSGLSTMELIKQYWLGFIPFIVGLLFPIFVFIAVIFFTSKMASRSEIIAILASGISYNRFLRPYFVGGILLAAILWYANREIIPRANVIKNEFQFVHIDKRRDRSATSEGCWNCFYRRIDSNTYIGVMHYDKDRRSAGRFFMERIQGNKVVYNLRADVIYWDTTKNNWKLTNATERIVDSMGERLTVYPERNIDLKIKPEDLRKDIFLQEKLTTPELVSFIEAEELRGTEGLNTLKVERYRRSATPVSVIVLTLIGAVIASRRARGGSGLHLAMGIIIAAIFVLLDRFSTVFSIKANFPPLIAAWLPNFIFLWVGIWLYRQAPK